jgi:hypothetical protein
MLEFNLNDIIYGKKKESNPKPVARQIAEGMQVVLDCIIIDDFRPYIPLESFTGTSNLKVYW